METDSVSLGIQWLQTCHVASNLTWSALLGTAELFVLLLFHKCKDLAGEHPPEMIHWNWRRMGFAWAEQDKLQGKVLTQLIRIHMSHHQQTETDDAGGTTKCKFYSHLLNIHLWWITLWTFGFSIFSAGWRFNFQTKSTPFPVKQCPSQMEQ